MPKKSKAPILFMHQLTCGHKEAYRLSQVRRFRFPAVSAEAFQGMF